MTLLEPSSEAEATFFGGPFELEVADQDPSIRLHRTLTIRGSQLARSGKPQLIGSIPLVYAFQHDQNEIAYRLRSSEVPGQGYWIDESSIDGLTLDPAGAAPDWPYRNYPALFPLVNLQTRDAGQVDRDTFCERYRLDDMGSLADEALVGIPTNRTLGFSMWGLEGDKQGILLWFKIHLARLSITAWHTF